MSGSNIIISGTGCALADFIYTKIRFESAAFLKYVSKKVGDGGLSPGKLVFTEDLEHFAGKAYKAILEEITSGNAPDSFNIGGPGVVSLIHASQMLEGEESEVRFYGSLGNDQTAEKILSLVRNTPLNIANYKNISESPTPFTDVFSDPTFDQGHGERTFVNNIGSAWDYLPDFLDDNFFSSDIVCFGGTALVPVIHKNLTPILNKAKRNNCITVVNTVYDFYNEKRSPGERWPLVDNPEGFRLIDVLIMDYEEAVKISGMASYELAAQYFIKSGVSAFIITNGPKDILAFSNGDLFTPYELNHLPVSERVKNELKAENVRSGDTTGCGDNFAGGIIGSIGKQLRRKKRGGLDFTEAIAWGVASGGQACFYKGGTFLEKSAGEKYPLVKSYYEDYLDQISRK